MSGAIERVLMSGETVAKYALDAALTGANINSAVNMSEPA